MAMCTYVAMATPICTCVIVDNGYNDDDGAYDDDNDLPPPVRTRLSFSPEHTPHRIDSKGVEVCLGFFTHPYVPFSFILILSNSLSLSHTLTHTHTELL